MSDASSLQHFKSGAFSINGKQFIAKGVEWTKRVYNDSCIEIYPGVLQHTPKYQNMLQSIHKDLMQLGTTFNGKEGYWFSSPHNCLTDWGSLSSPLLCPMEDNSSLRKFLKLRDPTSEELGIFSDLVDKVLALGETQSIHLKKVSSCGFPWMAPGASLKLEIINSVFPSVGEFVELTVLGRHLERYHKFGSYCAFTNGIRVQADKVQIDENGLPFTKQRFSYSKEDVEKQVFTKEIPIDKTCHDSEGNVVTGCVSARVRSMYALSYSDNWILQILNNRLYDGLKKVVKAMNYHGPEKLSDEIKAFLNSKEGFIFSLDKSNFGETFSPSLLKTLCNRLAIKNPLLGQYVADTIDAITFLRSYEKGQESCFSTRRTISKDPSLSLKGSFKSGHGLVAFLGKLLGVFDAILICKKAFGDTFSLDKFLANTDPRYRYYGSGDDTLFVCKNEADKIRICKAVESGASLHKDELEMAAAFLGHYYDNWGSVQVDIAKFIESMLGSERSYKSKTFHQLGVYSRYYRYQRNPYFKDVSKILERHFLSYYNFDVRAYIRAQTMNTDDDAIFLNDPDKVFYIPNLDVTPEILASEFAMVSAERLDKIFDMVK